MNGVYNVSKRDKRFIKEGRGQGEYENYLPWTKISDFPSQGRASRIKGLKTNRIHHFHSDNQLRAFYLFEWSDKVVDIRESYPLLDLMEVIDNKDDLRLDKFIDKELGNHHIITSNFLLTLKDRNEDIYYIARTIRNASDLSKKNVIEKLEIERRYWSSKGIDWKVVTNKELNRQYCKNIEWVRDTLIEEKERKEYMENLSKGFMEFIINRNDRKLKDVIKEYEFINKLDSGIGLYIFRYLVGKKNIKIDMRNKIDTSRKIEDLIVEFNN